MAKTPREIVRTAVGIAIIVPALGLAVLGVVLLGSGGFGGVLAGGLVGALAIGLLFLAFLVTYAPVTIAKLLSDTEAKKARQREEAGAEDGAAGRKETGHAGTGDRHGPQP